MKTRLIAVFQTRIATAFVVIAATIVAIPVFVCLLIARVCELGVSWIVPRTPVAAGKLRQLAEIAETRISGQLK